MDTVVSEKGKTMENNQLFDYERCENCESFRRLKHNFTVGAGHEDSYCCTLFVEEKDGFILEVSKNDLCECFLRRTE